MDSIKKEMDLESSYFVKLFNRTLKVEIKPLKTCYELFITSFRTDNTYVPHFKTTESSLEKIKEILLNLEKDYVFVTGEIYKKTDQKYVDLIVNYSEENKEKLEKYLDTNHLTFKKELFGMNTNIHILCNDGYESLEFVLVIVDESDNIIFNKSLIDSLDKVILKINELENFELKYLNIEELI
jgi:Icc-related predicted phosphoesterase